MINNKEDIEVEFLELREANKRMLNDVFENSGIIEKIDDIASDLTENNVNKKIRSIESNVKGIARKEQVNNLENNIKENLYQIHNELQIFKNHNEEQIKLSTQTSNKQIEESSKLIEHKLQEITNDQFLKLSNLKDISEKISDSNLKIIDSLYIKHTEVLKIIRDEFNKYNNDHIKKIDDLMVVLEKERNDILNKIVYVEENVEKSITKIYDEFNKENNIKLAENTKALKNLEEKNKELTNLTNNTQKYNKFMFISNILFFAVIIVLLFVLH
ncbi:hypothetical protein [Mammaliicoccus sciuri]|uniref:hypothetical protein n=1 Tax=Mammaliicoccus sciuri TaxID=1296 RepID=UPI003F558517